MPWHQLSTVSPGRLAMGLIAVALAGAAGVLSFTDRGDSLWVGFVLLGLVAGSGILHFGPWISVGLGVLAGLVYAGVSQATPPELSAQPGLLGGRALFFTIVGLLSELSGRLLIAVERREALGEAGAGLPASPLASPGPFKDSVAGSLLERELARARRYHINLAFGLLEIEGWDAAVQLKGRTEMVEALRAFNQAVRGSLRSADQLTYLGGGRCALILPHTDLGGAQLVVERIAEILRRQTGHTLRAGISEFPEDAETEEQLISEAEAALDARRRDSANSHGKSTRGSTAFPRPG